MQTTERIEETLALSGATRVDRVRGVISGVKILGRESRNGRTYAESAIKAAAGLYEGAKVNVNHPKGNPSASRGYEERLGSLRGVQIKADGLYGNLHYNPKHPIAEQLAWDAEHAPDNVGLSHNVEAKVARRGGKSVVEAIVKVLSVDLVADPATTSGLYESTGSNVTTQRRYGREAMLEEFRARHAAGDLTAGALFRAELGLAPLTEQQASQTTRDFVRELTARR